MTPRTFCQSGIAETTKGAVHGALGTLAAVCAAYNATAFYVRGCGDRRLFFNVCLYTVIVGLEAYQIRRHLRKGP